MRLIESTPAAVGEVACYVLAVLVWAFIVWMFSHWRTT